MPGFAQEGPGVLSAFLEGGMGDNKRPPRPGFRLPRWLVELSIVGPPLGPSFRASLDTSSVPGGAQGARGRLRGPRQGVGVLNQQRPLGKVQQPCPGAFTGHSQAVWGTSCRLKGPSCEWMKPGPLVVI